MALEIRQLKDKKTNTPFYPLTHWDGVTNKPTKLSEFVNDTSFVNEQQLADAEENINASLNAISNTLGLDSSFNVDWSEESGIPNGSTYKEAIEQQSKQLIDATEVVSIALNSMSDTIGLNTSFGVDWSEESGIPEGSTYKEAIEHLASQQDNDEKVKVNLSNEDRVFSLLAVNSSNPVDGSSYEAIYNTGIVINTSLNSIAEGYYTKAFGKYSHAEGLNTIARNEAEHAEGKYNISIANTTRHTVGIGTQDSSRKNAHLITTDGKHYIPGIGGYIGTEDNDTSLAGVQDLATVITNDEFQISNINSSLNDINQQLVNVEEVVSDAISTISDTLGLDSSFGVEWSSESGIPNGSTYKEAIEIAIGDGENMKSITWSELKTKRDNSQLAPGKQYRITDYVTTTSQTDTSSGMHQFDIIIVADDVNKLNENARAIQHSGDTYFANCKLESWQLKYCLDNDTTRFAWADSTNGKGVIWYMKDENENECYYDFKNIMFKPGAKTQPGTKANVFYYTFSVATGTNDSSVTDHSLNGIYCYGNKIGMYMIGMYISSDKQTLSSNVFRNTSTTSSVCYSNIFSEKCHNNTFGDNCNSNTFGTNCSNNTFGNDCFENTFKNSCFGNTFGNGCYENTFGNDCYGNTFGTNCSDNTFGNSCHENIFGNNCLGNTFGNSCYGNTFGNNCRDNTFGNSCQSNKFGNYCSNNTLGDFCKTIRFVKSTSTSTTRNYYRYIIVENGNQSINLDCTSTTSDSQYYQNVKIAQGVNNTTSYKSITDANVGQTYQTVYQPANSQVISV